MNVRRVECAERLFRCEDFLMNRVERQVGFDLNGDGYVGGEGERRSIGIPPSSLFSSRLGFMNKMERMTHIDFNRDNIIGRPPAYHYGYTPAYGPGYNTGFPPTGYGYGAGPYGYY